MNCCENCFLDSEIKNIIKGQNVIGSCDFCRSVHVHIYDTDDNERLLSDLLYGLLSVYSTSNSLPDNFPNNKKDLIKNILCKDWHIFNTSLMPETVYDLLKEICADKYRDYPELFDHPVGISEICDKEYLNLNSLLKGNSWDDFVLAIKTENRFHSDHINTDILRLFLDYARVTYKAGTIFYRARISNNSHGFPIDKMSAPPSELAKAGRVNSDGISVLYLADSIDTVVYEVRAGRYDYITIGTFELLEDIEVVSLNLLRNISPFMRQGDIVQHAVNLTHLSRLSHEVGRPLRRYDSNLDYLPTQYISDFIKSHSEVSGITYNSSMKEDGKNLAAFIPSQFRCTNVQVLEITGLQYSWKRLS